MIELCPGVSILQGDITRLDSDALVNAANSSLMGGGGVDGAIHRAGGGKILEECREIRRRDYPQGLPPGKAVITSAGEMAAGYVIHTVGPVWKGGKQGEEGLLEGAYRSSLALAAEKGLTSIAFPAISTGIYGYPKEQAARVALRTVIGWKAEHPLPEKICFVLFSSPDLELFHSQYREHFSKG